MMSKTRSRPALGSALLALALALSGCGGAGKSGQSASQALTASASPAASSSSARSSSAGDSAVTASGAAAGNAGAPGATQVTSATAGKPGAPAPAPIPTPLLLEKGSVYDDWWLEKSMTSSLQLVIKSNSCAGAPNMSVNEDGGTVTILVTDQILGDPACHGVPKTVQVIASILAPLGNRLLAGCRPAIEKTGKHIDCRTAPPD